MNEQRTPWQLTGPGMYPVEYASWLLSPLRYLVTPPSRIANRLQLSSTDHVLEIGCGPGFFSPSMTRKLSAGHLTLFDAQSQMLKLASLRMQHHGLTNYACACGKAERLPFAGETFDVAFMGRGARRGERPNCCNEGNYPRSASRRAFRLDRSSRRSGWRKTCRIGSPRPPCRPGTLPRIFGQNPHLHQAAAIGIAQAQQSHHLGAPTDSIAWFWAAAFGVLGASAALVAPRKRL
jgi:SAM-dependent methyltransferase